MADAELDDSLRRSLVSAWHQYMVALDPIRPQLFRYCRQLTGDLWDAEDLVQEALLKGFGSVSHTLYTIRNLRAYFGRIATNLWLDKLRGRAAEQAALASGGAESVAHGHSRVTSPAESSELRDAAAELMQRLAPKERAAFLLSEVFDLTLDETAGVLGITVGAAKSALHRGRERIKNTESLPARRPRPPVEILDRFVESYNARDLPALLSLMSDDATIDMFAFHTETGRAAFERKGDGWFHHNFHNPFNGQPTVARWQLAEVEGQPVVLVFGGIADLDTLTSVMRLETDGERVRHISVYAACPDVVSEVAEKVGVPVRVFGYHFPFDVSRQ